MNQMHSTQNVSNIQFIQKSITITSRSSSNQIVQKSISRRSRKQHSSKFFFEKTTQQKMKNQETTIEVIFILEIEFERFDKYRDN